MVENEVEVVLVIGVGARIEGIVSKECDKGMGDGRECWTQAVIIRYQSLLTRFGGSSLSLQRRRGEYLRCRWLV